MPNKTMKTKIQVRRDTTANWLTNKDVVPAAGEPCFDLELGTLKIGDGVTSYENLKEISGGQAAHYEGVKGDGESDTDVISRVLTAAGAEAQKDDIFVVKALIAGGKYSYTAYVYDGSVWAAMDGNYSAENVFFPENLDTTVAIGNITLTDGIGSVSASGKNLIDTWNAIFMKEKNPSVTQPSVSISKITAKTVEVGTRYAPEYSATLNPGKYEFKPENTGVTASSWEVSDTAGHTASTNAGTFDSFVVGDTTNYTITCKANYEDGAVPLTNCRNPYPAGQIKAGSKSATSGAIKGYRNSFYGTLEAKDGEVNSALVRGLSGKSGKALAAGNSFNLSIPVGAIRVVFAYPATLRDVSSVQDVNGMNAEVKTAFTKTVVSVEGANGYQAIDYKVYVMDMANANDVANTYKVTI